MAQKYRSVFLVLASFVTAGTIVFWPPIDCIAGEQTASATAPATTASKPTGAFHYDPGDPMYNYAHGGPAESGKPQSKTKFQVSPGEEMILGALVPDVDRYQSLSGGPWTNFTGVGPYKMTWTIVGDAEFDSVGSGHKTKTQIAASCDSVNINVFVKSTWTGATPITVTFQYEDDAPAEVAPNTGSENDPGSSFIWDIVKRGTPPTTITTIAGNTGNWQPNPMSLTYKVGQPLPAPATAPFYEGQTVLESWTDPKADGFTQADLNPTWAENTADQIAEMLFSQDGEVLSSFCIDSKDQMTDVLNVETTPAGLQTYSTIFLPAAITNGIGFVRTQTYSAGNNTLGTYVTQWRISSTGIVTIKRTNP